MTRLLITVSRSWKDEETAEHWLREAYYALREDRIVLVSGHAGEDDQHCDRLLERIWERHGQPVERHAADWRAPCREQCHPGHRRPFRSGYGTYCPAAGMYRNQDMVDLGAGLCLCLRELCAKPNCRKTPKPHWSHGAEACADMAEAAGITTWRVPA